MQLAVSILGAMSRFEDAKATAIRMARTQNEPRHVIRDGESFRSVSDADLRFFCELGDINVVYTTGIADGAV